MIFYQFISPREQHVYPVSDLWISNGEKTLENHLQVTHINWSGFSTGFHSLLPREHPPPVIR